MTGPRLLKAFLKQENLSAAEFARVSGFDTARLSRWTRGKRRPGLDSAERLEHLTRGMVPVTAWIKNGSSETA